MLELLKCPCCGDLPEISGNSKGGFWCHCKRYACDFPYAIASHDKENAIRAWNEEVLRYKENKKEES